jgi:hypothetical protein
MVAGKHAAGNLYTTSRRIFMHQPAGLAASLAFADKLSAWAVAALLPRPKAVRMCVAHDYASDWARWSGAFSAVLKNWAQRIVAWNFVLDEKGKANIGPLSCGGVVMLDSKTRPSPTT